MANTILAQTDPTPRFISRGFYLVDSRTETLVSYQVRATIHGWGCTCPAAKRGKACWHVAAVLQVEAAKAVEAARAAVQPEKMTICKRLGITLESLFA